MSITTKDLAQLCNVSRTTVHRALHGTGRINPETKELILKTAKEHGYRPDMLARGLVKGKTYQIGVVILDVDNRYFSQMLNAIEMEARKRGYFVNITLHEQNSDLEREQLQRLVDYHVDGIILSSINKGEEYKRFLEGLGTPIVTIDNKVAEGIPFVGIDGCQAVYEAVERIMAAGYRKAVFVCPPLEDREKTNIYVHENRLKGYLEGIKKAGLCPIVLDRWDYMEKGFWELKNSCERTAFCCTGDMIALDLMEYLKEKGCEPVKDYGIMGFDNIDFLKYVSPKLCTIDNSVEAVANTAVELLFHLMNGGEGMETEKILGYRIVDGETL